MRVVGAGLAETSEPGTPVPGDPSISSPIIGEPAVLGQAMERLHDRAGRVIWLNPLMASPDYAPETRGMQAALPHIDLLAPAHNVESLERLVRHLAI